MPMPRGRQAAQEHVDVALGPDVDAPCRLVDDQELRLDPEPRAQEHLLLVAAREIVHDLRGSGSHDMEIPMLFLANSSILPRRNPSRGPGKSCM